MYVLWIRSAPEKTFNPNDKYPTAFIDRKDMEYSYSDGDLYYFMDTETWEQMGQMDIFDFLEV